jgi:autotransporter-associated beta strand protein
MKLTNCSRHHYQTRVLLCALLAAATGALAANGTDTWNGGASTGNWGDAANWASGSANTPPITGDVVAFGTVGTTASVTNNLTTLTNVGVNFNTGAPSFALYGNAITNTNALVDNSANLQTINLPVVLGITTNITVVGGGSLTIGGQISGAFGFTNSGAGTLTLLGTNNTYTGITAVSAGTVVIGNTGLLGGGNYGGALPIAGVFTYNSSSNQTLSGVISGAGTLNQNGPGILTVTANNTISGSIFVNASELIASTGNSSVGAVTVAGAATNALQVNSPGGQWTCASLTYSSGAPYTRFNFAQTPGGAAPLQVNGNLTFTVAPGIIVTVSGAGIQAGQFPLIQYTGTLSGAPPTSLTLPAGVTGSLVNNTANKSIDLLVSTGTQVSWTGATSSVWDTTTANWGGPSTYQNLDYVVFADPLSGASPITVTLNTTVSPTNVLFDNNLKTYTIAGSGAISGLGSLTKEGANSATLALANTYTGATAVNAGALVLDFTQSTSPAANIISASSPLSLGGGALSLVSQSSASAQTFASTAVAGGGNLVTTSGTGAPTINLGTLTRTVGGAVEFLGPAYNSGASSGTTLGGNTVAATATINATANTVTGGLISTSTSSDDGASAYATVGLYDWAAMSTGLLGAAQNGNVVGGSQISGFYTVGGTLTANNANLDITGSLGSSGGTQYASQTWRFNAAAAATITLSTGKTCSDGGMLVTPNVGANNITITGGNLRPTHGNTGNTGFMIWQNNTSGELLFTPTGDLVNGTSGSTTANYTQAGPGTVNLSSGNSYTGQDYLDGGVTIITTDGALGAAGTAAHLNLNGGTLVGNASFALDNAGANPRPVVLINSGGGLGATAGNTLTVDGVVSGAAPLCVGIPASSANGNTAGLVPGTGSGTANATATNATGTVVLNSGANTYTGGTVFYSGILNFNTGSLGSGGLTFYNGATLQWANNTYDISAQTVTFNSGGGTLDVNGQTVTLANSIGNGGGGGLTVRSAVAGGVLGLYGDNTFSGGIFISGGSALAVGGAGLLSGGDYAGNITNNGALSFGSAAPLQTLAGVISGTGALNQNGSSALALSGANTYSGGTTVAGGVLLINNTNGSATGSGAVTIGAGGTLGGAGVISGAVAVNSGGALAPGSPPGTLTIGNNLTLAAGSTTYVQVQHLPLTNAAAYVSGTLTEGGALNVTNIGGAPLVEGDSFNLFNAGNYAGAFANVILPSLPAGLAWNTNALGASGVLSVVLAGAPVIGEFSLLTNGLVLTGTGGAANANYYLLSSTNIAAPLSNWARLLTNEFDDSGDFTFTNPPASGAPQEFFLLQVP